MKGTEEDSNARGGSADHAGRWDGAISVLLLSWIGLATAFFYIRFSFVFYEAHRGPINDMIGQLIGS